MYYDKTPTSKAVIGRAVIELIIVTGITLPLVHLYVFVQGNVEATHRGFFCDDESLKYPVVADTISTTQCFFLWASVIVLIVPAIEVLHCYRFPRVGGLPTPFENIPRFLLEIYRTMGYCFIGGLFTLVITEIAKHQIGRLRPYFLTACQLNETSSDSCVDSSNFQIFITNYTCSGDEKLVREGRKSFVSGHSSFSFYCATFLIIYLQTRLNPDPRHRRALMNVSGRQKIKAVMRLIRVLQPFIQFGIFVLAVYIALTRITDYKHHATDVLGGAVLGLVVGITVALFLLNLRRYPSIFFQSILEPHELDEMDGRTARQNSNNELLNSRM